MMRVTGRLLLVGFVVLALRGQTVTAADPSGSPAVPAPGGTPPATASPVAAAASLPDLATLLAGTNFAFRQPDKNKPVWRVTVESDNADVVVIDCEVETENWKYQDGTLCKQVQFLVQLTPFYTQDVEPSAKLLRTILEANDKEWFCAYALHTDPSNGQWALWTQANMFLHGASSETLSDYLTITAGVANRGKKAFLPLIK